MRRRWPLAACALVAGCAWADRANRPVWNAFEATLVPESTGAFVATLPLTAPAGLLAILTDTFLAHPLQVIDDAADDALDLWRRRDWEHHYYTEAGTAPLRAIATPAVFLLSFAGRSTFDIDDPDSAARERAAAAARQRTATIAWLQAVAAGSESWPDQTPPEEFDDELRRELASALASAPAPSRIVLYERSRSYAGLRAAIPWPAALRDPSAVVRWHALRALPKDTTLAEELVRALLADDDEAVRAAATKRWPR